MWFEMHLHTHFSMYDGFDKVKNKVKYAKELGMQALGIADHGNACGILQLYKECKAQGLKPLMGCEVYYQDEFDQEKPSYHLCLFAYTTKGYHNLCRVLSLANERNYYYKPRVTRDILEKYHEGLICSSACVAGIIPQNIHNKKPKRARNYAKFFQSIFGDDFYLEVQPIAISEPGFQEEVNEEVMKIADELGIRCILTTDSHYTRPDDFSSYMMMHRLSKLGAKGKGQGHSLDDIEITYRERYMHSEKQIRRKLKAMHPDRPYSYFSDSFQEIYDKIDINLSFEDSIPKCDDCDDVEKAMRKLCKRKLKETGRLTAEYMERLNYEVGVIAGHGLCDYFMIVYDYVKFAKDRDIYVGPGRGSVGGSLVAELLNITDIDPFVVGTDFARFMRPDKKKMPDIDLDFEHTRQVEVIEYIINKYLGRASRIITFGYYVSLNLINDMCKVREIEKDEVDRIKTEIARVVPQMAHFEFEDIDYDTIMRKKPIREIEREYPGFIKDFCALCGQVKYYGQHPAGVLVTNGAIRKWVPLMRVNGQLICSYDKYDVEAADMVKFDVLGLKTMTVIHQIEETTGDKFDRFNIPKKTYREMYERFANGDTAAIFQLNKKAAQDILRDIRCDNIQDVIAAISLNRPGTLQLRMHEQFAENKQSPNKKAPWYPYTKDSYGTIIYQEHVMRICNGLAKMDPTLTDKLMKFKFSEEERGKIKEAFCTGAKEHSGIPRSVSEQMFDSMSLYMFNKGHAAGYAEISEWMMYLKVRHPVEFWVAIMQNEVIDKNQEQNKSSAVKEGCIIFLPHVNGTAGYSIREFDGEHVIQEGYGFIKNVGEKAAQAIQRMHDEGGDFIDFPDFEERLGELPKEIKRSVNKRVIQALKDAGAFDFNEENYLKRVVRYNATLKAREYNGW